MYFCFLLFSCLCYIGNANENDNFDRGNAVLTDALSYCEDLNASDQCFASLDEAEHLLKHVVQVEPNHTGAKESLQIIFELSKELNRPKMEKVKERSLNDEKILKSWNKVLRQLNLSSLYASVDHHLQQIQPKLARSGNLKFEGFGKCKEEDGCPSQVVEFTSKHWTPLLGDQTADIVNLERDNVYLKFLRSFDFRKHYWEKFPVLLVPKTSKGKRERRVGESYHSVNNIFNAFSGLDLGKVTLNSVLNRKLGYKYNLESNKLHPNGSGRVVFLRNGTFDYNPNFVQNQNIKREEIIAALRSGEVAQFSFISRFDRIIGQLAYDVSTLAVQLPTNINMYITPPGNTVSLNPHTDFQCALMVQLQGRKRWKLWVKPSLALPVQHKHIKGRADSLQEEELGEPYMDVVVEAGEILYVPRGVVHMTSTPEPLSDAEANVLLPNDHENKLGILQQSSIHLTLGIESSLDGNVGTTWSSFFFGSDRNKVRQNPLFFTAFLYQMVKHQSSLSPLSRSLKETLPAAFYNDKIGYIGDKDINWRNQGRKIAHDIIDAIFENKQDFPLDFDFFTSIQEKLRTSVLLETFHLLKCVKVHKSKGDKMATPGSEEWKKLDKQWKKDKANRMLQAMKACS
eukprot:g6300.t1